MTAVQRHSFFIRGARLACDVLTRLVVLSLLLAVFLLSQACAPKNVEAPAPETVTEQHGSFDRHLARSVFAETESPWLSGRLVPRRTDSLDIPLLRVPVTLRQKGTLSELAASVTRIAPVGVLVAESDGQGQAKSRANTASGDLDDLLSDLSLASGPGSVDVNWSGPLRGLLDLMAAQSGYGWDYEEASRRVVFSAAQVRTFVVAAPAGTVSWESSVSNRSRDRQTSVSGSSINSTMSTGDTSTQTAQVNTMKTSLDIWKDIEETVRGLLSRAGSVHVNQAAGTLTVRDTCARLRDVERCVADINARLARQVALRVRVWALEVSDASEAGLSLQTLFTSPDVSVVAGTASSADSGLASVSILKGKLEGSSGILKALREWGHATQLTSASGLALNNQPFPVQAVRRHAYLAGMTMSTSEYSQTSEITPGEVTTGFAMTNIPHILPDRHVLLQYNITLSTLEDMTTIDRDTVYVQLPQVSTRSFSQRTRLKTGQTLMLAGFEQDTAQASKNLGLLSAGRAVEGSRTLLVITMELEGADNV